MPPAFNMLRRTKDGRCASTQAPKSGAGGSTRPADHAQRTVPSLSKLRATPVAARAHDRFARSDRQREC